MEVTNFFQYLQKNYNLKEDAINLLETGFIEEFVAKGSNIIEQGKPFYDVIFLIKGAVYSSIERADKEIIPYFGFENDLIAIPLKQNFRASATLTTLEDSIIIKIKIKHFEKIMQENNEISYMMYQFLKKMLSNVAKEFLDYSGYDAQVQYLKLIEDNPNILKRIPLKYIALNIGITPSTLSKIRARTKII